MDNDVDMLKDLESWSMAIVLKVTLQGTVKRDLDTDCLK